MSRAYRITVRESVSREITAGDAVRTRLELLDILPPEATAGLLREELKARGFREADDGTLTRTGGNVTVTADPCSGELTVEATASDKVKKEGMREAGGYDDVGPGRADIDARAREQLRKDLERQIDREEERLQAQATAELEKHLNDLQPEVGEIVNKVTREALKRKATQMGTITEISEDDKSGSLTIKLEV